MNLRVNHIVVVALWCVMWAGICQAGQMMSLDQCLDYGLENNPGLKGADYALAATEENKKSVRADFMPGLSTSYSFSRFENDSAKGVTDTDYLNQYVRSFSVILSQTLYAGHRILNTYQRAALDYDRMDAERRLTELELTYQIQTAFFQLMGAKQDVAIAQEAVTRLDEGVKAAKAYLEKSLIPYTEALTAEVDLADAQQRLSRYENEVNRKRIALFSLMNMPTSDQVAFYGGLDFFSGEDISGFDSCWAKAIQNRPDLESLSKQVEMLEKDSDIALGAYLPMVKLELGYHDQNRDYDVLEGQTYDRDQRNRYFSAGISASWELFDGGRSWYRNKKSMYEVQQVKEQIKNAQLFIKEGIRKALFSIGEAKLRFDGAKKALGAAEENYKVEKRRLEAGLTTVPLLLDAQVRLTRAQGNLTQAQLDYQLGRSELDFMMGENYMKVDNKGY